MEVAVAVAQRHKTPLYLVGGFLRDWVLGHFSWDLDFVVATDPIAFAGEVAERLPARFVLLSLQPPTGRVTRWEPGRPDACVDFTQLEGSIFDDARRRDFTCNALFVDVITLVEQKQAPFLDPLGGLQHLRQRVLMPSHEQVLREDPLRLLRAFRLAATRGLSIAPETMIAIRQAAPSLPTVASERLAMELSWILQAPNAHEQLLAMDQAEVLAHLLPELMDLKKVPAVGYHHLDGFHHTIEAVRCAELVMKAQTENCQLNELLKKVTNAFQQPFGYQRSGAWVLKFATLLHDIAKPQTMTVDEEGDLHFYGHERVGAEIAEQICHRFRLSRKERELVVTLVRSHMRPVGLAGAKDLTERALRRFWRELGDLAGIYCVALSAADLMGTRGPEMTEERRQRHYHVLVRLLETYFALQEARQRIRLITGDEVMARYHIPPSPLVGKALRLVEEAVLEGRVQTKEQAWALLDEVIPKWQQLPENR